MLRSLLVEVDDTSHIDLTYELFYINGCDLMDEPHPNVYRETHVSEHMKLGCISDIHGNRVALETVLDDMPAVDTLICCGDIVGYNPWPADCVTMVREAADVIVQGNHDRVVQTPARYRGNPSVFEGLRLAKNKLSEEQLDWLDGLPEQTTAVDGRVRVIHSHPSNLDEYVHPGQFPQMVQHLAEAERCLLLGHTHVQHTVDMRQFEREEIIVNPGSVGQPRDSDPRAAYAVIDTADWEVNCYRVEYDVDAVQRGITEAGLPEKTGKRLESGR